MTEEIKTAFEAYEDYISRQEVYKIIGELHVGDVRFFEKLRRGLEALPSIQPDVKKIYNIGFSDGVKAYKNLIELEKEEEETKGGLYIKVYAKYNPQEKAEKLYQICESIDEMKEVIEELKEYCDSEEETE